MKFEMELFKDFNDPATAKELFSLLRELENLSICDYFTVYGTIKGRVLKLREEVGKGEAEIPPISA
ncbi:MAG: hypothetical protein GY710_15820 [Desulfobacteraceae bacterium]|nr:hypothetical protein [Desulfobacteraceae bacterium]